MTTEKDNIVKEEIKEIKQIPTIGRIVHYKLSEQNVAEIMRRRTTGASIKERMEEKASTVATWPQGAQAHIGNDVMIGDVFPMMITKVWSEASSLVSGQVFLDGCDVLWVVSVTEGDSPGCFSWPMKI